MIGIDNLAGNQLIVFWRRLAQRKEKEFTVSRYSSSELVDRFLAKNRRIIVAQTRAFTYDPRVPRVVITLRLQNAYKLHVPAFSNRSDSEAPAMETRYIRFASDYICNRDGLSFRGALITGLDPPRLLAFPPSLLPFAPFFLQCSPCRSTHHFSP